MNPSPPVGLPTEAPRLLPCPFCGAALDYNVDDHFQCLDISKWGYVSCGCSARGPDVRTGYKPISEWKAAAAAAWNERAERTPVAAEGEALVVADSLEEAQHVLARGDDATSDMIGRAIALLRAPAAKGRETGEAS